MGRESAMDIETQIVNGGGGEGDRKRERENLGDEERRESGMSDQHLTHRPTNVTKPDTRRQHKLARSNGTTLVRDREYPRLLLREERSRSNVGELRRKYVHVRPSLVGSDHPEPISLSLSKCRSTYKDVAREPVWYLRIAPVHCDLQPVSSRETTFSESAQRLSLPAGDETATLASA